MEYFYFWMFSNAEPFLVKGQVVWERNDVHVGHRTGGWHAWNAVHCDNKWKIKVKKCFCFPSDAASFPESAAEHEGQTGAVRLNEPQSAELCSFSQNFIWKRVWWLFACKLTAKFSKLTSIHPFLKHCSRPKWHWLLLLTWVFYILY